MFCCSLPQECGPVKPFPSDSGILILNRHVLKYSSEREYYRVKKIVSHENQEISIEELVETYYNNPENYFQAPAEATPQIKKR
jgi:hypothetical protein